MEGYLGSNQAKIHSLHHTVQYDTSLTYNIKDSRKWVVKIIPVEIKNYYFKKWLQIKSACFSKSLELHVLPVQCLTWCFWAGSWSQRGFKCCQCCRGVRIEEHLTVLLCSNLLRERWSCLSLNQKRVLKVRQSQKWHWTCDCFLFPS